MAYSQQRQNIITCPGCGVNLINTAKQCPACGYCFTEIKPEVRKKRVSKRLPLPLPIAENLPAFLGLIILLLAAPALVILGQQKREQTENLVAADQVTATFLATIYVSPTPSPTMTSTPGPPTSTPIVYIDYVVAPGDSCLSIATKFHVYVESIVTKNNIDCSLLNIGTVLKIPPPVPTEEATATIEGTEAP